MVFYTFELDIEAIHLNASLSNDVIHKPTHSNTVTITTKNKGSVLYGTYDEFDEASAAYNRLVDYVRSRL